MLCDDCGRHEAVVHITQIGPNGRVEKNLCESCAAGYREFTGIPQERRHVSVDDFLRGIFNSANVNPADEDPAQNTAGELVCPRCGMSYRDFSQQGKIGCAACYATFRGQLEPMLRRIHGSSVHRGKIPHRSGGTLELKQNIVLLQQELKTCVEKEEYEKAAEIRDKVRAMKQELAAKEGGRENA
ncbi:protein arginine kinase activator [Selenomonas ruminantium]|uniref:Protein arginine kinase activator n=1 Tax=Selenomonas ruminantium TaxID=971 RepID=A0A1M6V741_SELRU|nr:UvrB/UvrC motif-containing protein [Selenomonas ruminantium]SHK77299.1 protein arginine kinase activator [Selenomonas ruminantium]